MLGSVSIPERVLEALKLFRSSLQFMGAMVSIPERVLEALKLYWHFYQISKRCTCVSIPERVLEALKL